MLGFHWQNLNERPGDTYRSGASGHPFWHGRAWIGGRRLQLNWSWNFKSRFCHMRLDVDGSENELTLALALPPVALWFTLSGRWLWPLIKWLGCAYENNSRPGADLFGMERQLGLSVHHWSIWWDVWSKAGSWSSTDPKWMHGSFDIPAFFLGRTRYTSELIEKRAVVVPMPEGAYDASAEFTRDTWKRPRWPFAHTITRTSFDIPHGIPVPGKGENSWDCGPDATSGFTCSAGSIEEGIGALIISVLETRRRRGAPADYSERAA